MSARIVSDRVTFFVRFSRAREAEPSAARRILAARLERGAADFSFQLNSAVAAELRDRGAALVLASSRLGRVHHFSHPLARARR